MASSRHSSINTDHKGVATSLHQIRRENEIAVKLRKNLEHEMVVLEERKAVSYSFTLAYCAICMLFCCLFFSKLTIFKKRNSGVLSECKTVWIQIRADKMSGLIWIQTVCKGFQQTTKVPICRKSVNTFSSSIVLDKIKVQKVIVYDIYRSQRTLLKLCSKKLFILVFFENSGNPHGRLHSKSHLCLYCLFLLKK